MAALPYESEEFEGSVGILRDVSDERARAARNWRRTKTRALDEAPVGITISDPALSDNPMVYVNDRFVEMTGYDRDDAVGVNCRFLQGEDTDERPVARLREAIDAEEPESVELLNYRKEGTPFWNRVSVAPIRAGDGSVSEWVGFQGRISRRSRTARRRSNARTIGSTPSRASSRTTFGTHSTSRRAASSSRGSWPMTHRISTPRPTRSIGSSRSSTHPSRSPAGETVGDPEPVAVAEVVADSWETVDTGPASLSVEVDGEALADPDRLRNLFENLIRNGVEHAGDDVQIRVGDLSDGFFVEDDGSGIPDTVRENLFEPGASAVSGNTGFGLAIVKEIATAHGWTVEAVDAADGGGAVRDPGIRRPASAE